jgi:hypothetical protein
MNLEGRLPPNLGAVPFEARPQRRQVLARDDIEPTRQNPGGRRPQRRRTQCHPFVCWFKPLTHSEGLKYRICRVSVKPRLELSEQLTGDRSDILDARHRQQ